MGIKRIDIIMRNKDIASVFVVMVAILAVPLVAMQYTNEVKWGLFDFIGMGALLIGIGLLIVLARRKIKNTNYRIAVIVALVLALLFVWVEGSVGIFDSPFAGS